MFTTQLHKPAAAEFLPGKKKKERNSGTKSGCYFCLEWDDTNVTDVTELVDTNVFCKRMYHVDTILLIIVQTPTHVPP
tara:strand:- start:46 stop:279 length:234 start_codon:yes stop_codon:yes gene_type:complete